VPNLDSAGFPLLGGRLDYIDGRTVAVVVYGRRQHMINVFSWPAPGDDRAASSETRNGFHLLHLRQGGIEQWIVSDLNLQELEEFSRRYQSR
jgi:anti-sigma factor RsiW